SATVPLKSIAYAAKEKGLKVGITTTVSIDHATPASFYANRANRSMYYEIAQDLIKSNFDFFGGSGFLRSNTTFDKKEAPSIFPKIEQAGYTLIKGYDNFKKQRLNGQKMVLVSDNENAGSLEFGINRKGNELRLSEITTAAVDALSAKNDKGFFLMVEGGKIDHASHANDAATVLHEVLDFNESVKVAYEFYKKHPEETLIVITADHETGGLIIGAGSSNLSTKNLQYQKLSQSNLSALITNLRDTKPNAKWDDVKNILRDNLGLWRDVKVSKNEEKPIFEAYEASFINHKDETKKTLYANDNKIAALAVALLNKKSGLGWASTNHSATAVPVFAVGVGAERFNHSMDNTDIPKKIAESAGLDL
ncbi:MAG TPA: alkaline phosphatase, partial [Sphingobacterium sp.]|nr:alkaline phosphatase [Sphingobacterium sp.]